MWTVGGVLSMTALAANQGKNLNISNPVPVWNKLGTEKRTSEYNNDTIPNAIQSMSVHQSKYTDVCEKACF